MMVRVCLTGLMALSIGVAAGCKGGSNGEGRERRVSSRASAQAQRESPIHAAAAIGDVATIQKLVKDGTPVDSRVGADRTALHVATADRQYAAARTLIELGADTGAQDGTGKTALMNASGNGATETVQLILSRKPNINAQEARRGFTALHYACERGRADIVALLVKAGADQTILDRRNRTALGVSKGNAAVQSALAGTTSTPMQPMPPRMPPPPPAPLTPPPPAPPMN